MDEEETTVLMEVPDQLVGPVADLIREYDKAAASSQVNRPVPYALYHAWRIWDAKTGKKARLE